MNHHHPPRPGCGLIGSPKFDINAETGQDLDAQGCSPQGVMALLKRGSHATLRPTHQARKWVAVMTVQIVSNRDFSHEVLNHDAPVVVAFRAGWCAPSQQLIPVVDEFAARRADQVKVVAVDVEADPQSDKICRHYKVTRLPMVMVFRDGQVVDFIGGAATPDNVADMIERQLRPVIEVNEFNFEAEVLKSRMPVLVHVDARWCAASQDLVPEVESAAEKFRGRAKVVRLEFGPENARLCAQYDFLRVPVLAVFNRGRMEDQILGRMEGGTKTAAVRTSCVGLTTADNIAEMLEPFAL